MVQTVATKTFKTVQDITLIDDRGIRSSEGDPGMDDDGFHGPGPEKDWSEEFYFDFYDRERDLCGHMRIALRPNLREKEFQFSLLMPDGSAIGGRERLPFDSQRIEAKGLAFAKVMPQGVWHISMNANMPRVGGRLEKRSHVEMDLTFTGLNETFVSEERASGVSVSHAQQFGTVKGRLSTGIEEFSIDTLGSRDHSWGALDLGQVASRMTLTCQFSKDQAFGVVRCSSKEGDTDAGYVHVAVSNRAVDSATVRTNAGPDGSPKSIEVTLTDSTGASHKALAMVLKIAKTVVGEPQAYAVHKMLLRCSTEGKVGYGMAELWVVSP